MMITIQLSNKPQPQQPQQQQMAFVPTADTTTTINNNDDECTYQDRPCEKYRQFMDSSRQERTLMIEKLVETFANVIDSIWHPKFFMEQQAVKVMPTRGFINEILKRSKATYSTLQISLFYIFRVKKAVHYRLYQRSKNANMPMGTLDELMCCGRRMFLASLMLASKYLHDKNYQNKAWSQITGLDIKEINAAEMAFLTLIDYRLYVSKPTFDKWYTQLHGHIQRSCKVQLTQSEQQQEKVPCAIPSPPPEMQQQLAPLSPPSEKGPNCITYQRSDSGVSFMSPPQQEDEEFTSKKRQWNDQSSEESDFFCSSKRLCQ